MNGLVRFIGRGAGRPVVGFGAAIVLALVAAAAATGAGVAGASVEGPPVVIAPGPTSPAVPGQAKPAPTSATGFNPRTTVVPIAFPLPANSPHRYMSAWRTPRVGVVYRYNQIRGVASNDTLLRAHDGVDIQAPIGTLVYAPFSGVVVDPRTIWKPWDPARYGQAVAIRSSESTSRGYFAILVHLSRENVRVGQVVKRGQVVGRTGISGNAAETIPHLHFELRAPFPIAFHYAGVLRYLDNFDPMPSLRAADPQLH